MRRSVQLIAGWMLCTLFFVSLAVVLRPLAIVMFVAWVIVTVPVGLELARAVIDRRRAMKRLIEAMKRPHAHRTIILPSAPPQVPMVEPSGMIFLPEGDRDLRWVAARERQRLQQSAHLHVDRELRPLTDCPAGHYDYHELRRSSLDRVVRRCAWCLPSVGSWIEGPVGNEDSER